MMAPKSSLLLILILAVFSEIAATSVSVSEQGITFEVGTAVSMALIPLFGPGAAAVSAAACSLGIWIIQPSNRTTWKKNWEQLSFNIGMHSIAIFIAGIVFINVQEMLGAHTFWGQFIPWIVAAVLYDQLNFWMLMVIIRLKQGPSVQPLAIWNENLWAVPINIIILSVGGGVLATAIAQFGLTGILVFFLPIVLSAYAFRLYVRQMQEHMDNLESIVAERTSTLEKLMKEKDAFLAVLTHDMKSPLTSIHLYATMIKEYPNILGKKPHLIDTVLRSQETLIDIVNNILDLEKLQADGQLPIEKDDFDLGALATKVIEMLQAQAESKSIDLQLQGFDMPIVVHADHRHMERVLNNLISNAIKYTAKNGSVKVLLQLQDSQIHIQVQDSGYGIPAEDLPYIFDRYRRVEAHKKVAAGSGLGLATTKALIEAHDEKIEVTSEVGKGSTFTAHLPILTQYQPIIHEQSHLRDNSYSSQNEQSPNSV